MFGKLYNVATIASIATTLALGGVLGYLGFTGRLSKPRMQMIGAVLRGELDAGALPTSQPAAAPDEATSTTKPAGPAPTRELARLDEMRIERAQRDLAAQQQLLDQTLQNLMTEQEQIGTKQHATRAPQAKAAGAAAEDAGFTQQVELVSGLQPKQAKEYLLRLWAKQPVDAVRLMKGLDAGRAKRILGQFKTTEEMEIMSQLLEQLSDQDAHAFAKESGKTRGNATP